MHELWHSLCSGLVVQVSLGLGWSSLRMGMLFIWQSSIKLWPCLGTSGDQSWRLFLRGWICCPDMSCEPGRRIFCHCIASSAPSFKGGKAGSRMKRATKSREASRPLSFHMRSTRWAIWQLEKTNKVPSPEAGPPLECGNTSTHA